MPTPPGLRQSLTTSALNSSENLRLARRLFLRCDIEHSSRIIALSGVSGNWGKLRQRELPGQDTLLAYRLVVETAFATFVRMRHTREMAAARVLDRLLEPLTECFTPEVASRVASLRADPETQQRLDELAAKANEGDLTDDESDEYRDYVEAIDVIGILQAKARVAIRKGDRA